MFAGRFPKFKLFFICAFAMHPTGVEILFLPHTLNTRVSIHMLSSFYILINVAVPIVKLAYVHVQISLYIYAGRRAHTHHTCMHACIYLYQYLFSQTCTQAIIKALILQTFTYKLNFKYTSRLTDFSIQMSKFKCVCCVVPSHAGITPLPARSRCLGLGDSLFSKGEISYEQPGYILWVTCFIYT